MKKSLFSMLILCLIGLQSVFAQSREISGVVTSADDGLSIPGVSVIIKGTTIGTTTDFYGNYSLNVPQDGTVLVFSFVGMTTQEVPISGTKLNVVMESESIGMDEVMVVAYGTTKKSSFTGSASVVKADKLKDVPVVSFDNALQGNVAGLEMSSANGQPGSAANIRIRGIGSINASQEPLYVIDGVATISGDLSSVAPSSNILANLNPSDIESITVLKDAAAASLYGSRAANGVIVITTKQGKSGKTKLNFKASYGKSDFAMDNMEVVSNEDWDMLQKEAYVNYFKYRVGLDDAAAETEGLAAFADDYPMPADGYVNWQDELFRKGEVKNYELSASGGNDKTRFFVSGSVLDQEGVAIGSDFLRYTGRANVNHKVNDKLDLGINLSTSYSEQNTVQDGSSYYVNPWFAQFYHLYPTLPIYNEDGTFNEDVPKANNVADLAKTRQETNTFQNITNAWFQYKILPELTLKSTFGFNFIDLDELNYWSPSSNDGAVHGGYANRRSDRRYRLTSSNILNYTKTFNEVHNVSAMFGYEFERNHRNYFNAEGKKFPSDDFVVLNASAKPDGAAGNITEDRMVSYLSRLQYNFDNKYYIEGSARRDGSTRLGNNEKWANFYAVSGSWRISQEDFMQDVSFVDDLKFKASYGTNGTLPSDLYGHLPLMSTGSNYDGEAGVEVSQVANEDLTWEKSKNFNAGIEYRVFNRLSGTIDYFERTTSDLLLEVELSRTTGLQTMWQNIGEMKNKGIELTFNADILKDGDLKWNMSLNLSHVKNEITKLYGGNDIIDGSLRYSEGHSIRSFNSREWAGVDPETGQPMWYVNDMDENGKEVDADGDGERDITLSSSGANRKIIGSADPDFTGGIVNNFSYKGFSLSFQFNFSKGGSTFDNTSYITEGDGAFMQGYIRSTQLARWQKPGDITDVPRRIAYNNDNGSYTSSRRLHSSDYIRLKNLTLAYSFPKSILNSINFDSARVYFSGSNLWTSAKYDDYDPESASINGFVGYGLPIAKTYTVGVEIGF